MTEILFQILLGAIGCAIGILGMKRYLQKQKSSKPAVGAGVQTTISGARNEQR